MNEFKLRIAISIGIFPCLLLWAGCGELLETDVAEDPISDPCLSSSMVQKITTEEVGEEPVSRSLLLSGEIAVNNDRVFRVHPTASGIVTNVNVRLGDRVSKGQILATVQSPDIAEFKRDKQSALAEKALAKRNLSLAESLLESGVYSRRDLLEAQSTLDRAESEVKRMREMQKVLGIEGDQDSYALRAPESGFVVERNINPGISMRSDDPHAFKISDLRDVWVVANVSESDIRNVRIGDTVTIRTLAFPDLRLEGEIVRLSSAIDPGRRTMEAIIEMPNPDFQLKPGMFASIDLKVREAEALPSISSSSLIFDNNEYFAVVFNDPCSVEIRKLNIHSRTGQRTYLNSGLQPGESVVSSRHILVYNKLNEDR
jgi:membrane fusion protein, heavy metal efflux system